MPIILFLGLLFCTACAPSKYPYIEIIDAVAGKKAQQLSKEEDLNLIGVGGAMTDEITMISYHFETRRNVDIDEARRLCVRCIEEIRAVVNATESLIPFLKPYPFPPEGMDVSIMFCDENWAFAHQGCVYLGEGGISVVYQQLDRLYYDSYNACAGRLESFYKEPYEEALRIYLEQAAP